MLERPADMDYDVYCLLRKIRAKNLKKYLKGKYIWVSCKLEKIGHNKYRKIPVQGTRRVR